MLVPGFLGPERVPQDCAVWLVGAAGRGFREVLQPPDKDWPQGGPSSVWPHGWYTPGLHGLPWSDARRDRAISGGHGGGVWMRDGARLPRGWTTPASIPSPARVTRPACLFAPPGWVLPPRACVRQGAWIPEGPVDNRRWDAS